MKLDNSEKKYGEKEVRSAITNASEKTRRDYSGIVDEGDLEKILERLEKHLLTEFKIV